MFIQFTLRKRKAPLCSFGVWLCSPDERYCTWLPWLLAGYHWMHGASNCSFVSFCFNLFNLTSWNLKAILLKIDRFLGTFWKFEPPSECDPGWQPRDHISTYNIFKKRRSPPAPKRHCWALAVASSNLTSPSKNLQSASPLTVKRPTKPVARWLWSRDLPPRPN